jgi:hypothetical protein
VAAGLSPGQFLLHAPSPGLTDGLTGVTAGSACRCAVEKRKELFIHPPAKVLRIVAAAIDERTDHKGENEAGLGQLAGFESGMVSIRLWIGITVDPIAVVAAKFGELVVPVRTQAQGITDEGTHNGPGGTILDVFVRHLLLFVFFNSLQVVSQSQTLPIVHLDMFPHLRQIDLLFARPVEF